MEKGATLKLTIPPLHIYTGKRKQRHIYKKWYP
jgi:hypothetical protein